MANLQRLLPLALLCAAAQVAIALPSLARPAGGLHSQAQDAVQITARKGTRAYSAGDATVSHDTTADQDAPNEGKALSDCIAIWDERTHISPSKWKEICKRQIKERGAYLNH